MKTSDREIVTRKEIKDVFKGTNFGNANYEDLIKWGLLKIASGYATGYTIKTIFQELKLLSKTKCPKLTKRGQYCLWIYHSEDYRNN